MTTNHLYPLCMSISHQNLTEMNTIYSTKTDFALLSVPLPNKYNTSTCNKALLQINPTMVLPSDELWYSYMMTTCLSTSKLFFSWPPWSTIILSTTGIIFTIKQSCLQHSLLSSTCSTMHLPLHSF